MRAAIVRARGQRPELGDWPEPVVGPGATLVEVTAVAVSPLARSRAAGVHYSQQSVFPLVAGVDGVGRTPEGRRVYFGFLPHPQGSLAERAAAPADRLLPIPDDLDDATAAAAAIPGMSAWLPLSRRVAIPPGEGVLVNGATGAAGRLALQVARHWGAAHVVATGRDPAQFAELKELGADRVISVAHPGEVFREEVRAAVTEFRVGVILDYLWGPSAAELIAAIGTGEPPRGPDRVRLVEVGALSGDTVSLSGAALRSSGLEILGSGIGSTPPGDVRAAIGEVLRAFRPAGFRIRIDERPFEEIGTTWPRETDVSARTGRLVYRLPGAGPRLT